MFAQRSIVQIVQTISHQVQSVRVDSINTIRRRRAADLLENCEHQLPELSPIGIPTAIAHEVLLTVIAPSKTEFMQVIPLDQSWNGFESFAQPVERNWTSRKNFLAIKVVQSLRTERWFTARDGEFPSVRGLPEVAVFGVRRSGKLITAATSRP